MPVPRFLVPIMHRIAALARRATPARPRDGDERWLRLASKDGVDSWLDFQTGEVSEWTAPDVLARRSLLSQARAAFDEFEMPCYPSFRGGLILHLGGNVARFIVWFTASDATREFCCATAFGATIPDDRHAETHELCDRLNERNGAGTFELDDEDGTVVVRLRWTAPEDDVQPERIRDSVFRACNLAEWAHEAFMQVAYGGLTADEVLGWGNEG